MDLPQVFYDYESETWCCLDCWHPGCRQRAARREPEPICGDVHPAGVYVCTRDPGHPGHHFACGPALSQHPLFSWRYGPEAGQ